MNAIISNFKIIRPRYEAAQSDSLDWLAYTHSYFETNNPSLQKKFDDPSHISTFMKKMVQKFSCSPNKIKNRGSEIPDFLHLNFEEMKIFNLIHSAHGANLNKRMDFFEKCTLRIFEEMYADVNAPPQNIVHVSCTGYASPSAAQTLVSQKEWGEFCAVTHAYHMGCYAALPALRMAQGFLHCTYQNNPSSLNQLLINKEKKHSFEQRVDIVHTELCTLHFNPTIHTPEEFIIQSLFADGFISYSIFPDNKNIASRNQNSFEILAIQEIIYSNSLDAMTWKLSNFGFSMTLSPSVPSIIAENIEKFLERMFQKSNLCYQKEKTKLIFAIHPGGPKIIDYISDILNLTEDNVFMSKEILSLYGNMSSATLPHIWEKASQLPSLKGTLIASLAFGPGLTIAGCLMRII